MWMLFFIEYNHINAGNILPVSKFLPRQFLRYHALKVELARMSQP